MRGCHNSCTFRVWLLGALLLGAWPNMAVAGAQDAEAIRSGWLKRPVLGAEARFGLYRPEFSSDPEVQKLYSLIYDDAQPNGKKPSFLKKHPFLIGAEADAYFFRAFGLIGAYARLSTWHAKGATRVCSDGANNAVDCTSATVFSSSRGNDSATLWVLPVGLGLIWRTDELSRRTHIPILLHAKAGLDYHLWWTRLGDRGARYQGHGAKGATLGYRLAAGLGLDLNAFSHRHVTSNAHAPTSSIFIEYEWVRGAALAGSGRSHRVDFTDNALVNIGAAFIFH